MNKKFTSGLLFIFAIFIGAGFINTVSAQSAVSTTIVISQVYGGGGANAGTPTYTKDYVELKNISSTAQSLDGLSIYYGSATGQFGSSAGNTFALPTGVTLQPGQYYLVEAGPVGTAGGAIPVTPDASTTNLTMSATSGKVALVNGLAPNSCGATMTPCTLPNAQIIDVVAYGTANNAEGNTPTDALTNTSGAVRKQGGCQDTDNNAGDFDIITAPVPRNTATTPAPCGAVVPGEATNDLNGDGKSDYIVVRNVGGGPNGQIRWFYNLSGTNTPVAVDWGLATDFFLLEDYDGDNKDDITVWRNTGGNGVFYILNSSNNTARVESLGLAGDDPEIAGDYDGDGKADPAVYRGGANAGEQSIWYYRGSLNNPSGNITYVPWGQNSDFVAPGDYDGDGKNDFVIQRNNGGGQARFWRRYATGATDTVVFGTPTDNIVPGDYDGDNKTDLAVFRGISGQVVWFILPSTGAAMRQITFGLSATDFSVQGDYDGDGKDEPAVWRPDVDPTQNYFYSLNSTNGAVTTFELGQNGDYPVANWNRH